MSGVTDESQHAPNPASRPAGPATTPPALVAPLAPLAPVETLSETEELFERWRKAIGWVAAPLAFLAVWFLTRGSLKPEGQKLSAVLAAVGVLWMTESLPLPVTALLGALLCVLLGVGDARTVLAPFADPIVFVFIGGFMLARAMTLHHLDRRLAFGFLSLPFVGGHPGRVLAGFGLITALISMWVSNTATTAMMVPIALGVLQALDLARGGTGETRSLRAWPYATGMMLMVAYAASIGGIGTPVGSPPNLIAIGQLRATGHDLSFFKWVAVMTPIFAVMAVALFVLLYLLHRPGPVDRTELSELNLRDYLRHQSAALGPWTAGQINTLLAFAVAVTLWILPGVLAALAGDNSPPVLFFKARLPEEIVAVLAALLLFVLPVRSREPGASESGSSELRPTLTWPEAVRIDWGTILLFGGGLSLGRLMFTTDVARALGTSLTQLTGAESLWGLTAAAIAIGIVLSETTSNTAASSMLVPVVISLAHAAGVSPVPPVLGACLGASYGFMLPVSTPPNAIAYGSGLVPIPRMVRAGVVFDVLGFFIILAGLRLLCPMLGLM